MTSTTILAAGTPADTWPGMGVAGTVVFLAICVATFFLWRNMNHQIDKVHLPTEEELAKADVAAGTARPGTAAKLAARSAQRRRVGPSAGGPAAEQAAPIAPRSTPSAGPPDVTAGESGSGSEAT